MANVIVFFPDKLPGNMVTIFDQTALSVSKSLLEIGAIRLNPGQPFTWSSGWKSPIYCDNRLALSYPAIRTSIKNALVKAICDFFANVQSIAGVATAGIAQGALVADNLNLPFLYVRPKPKDHGMQNLIEGKIEKGQRVVLVEDLISTGGSSIKAAEALRDAGFNVVGMVAIFTYGFDAASQNFENSRIPLVCLSDFSNLLTQASKMNFINKEDLELVRKWREKPDQWGK